ncbi:DNA methylase N-4/N-6 domain protein [Methanosalsum zhilinae DSM 4017]|uniref:site-specific DNA-methyltransferase (cytosine-N(4)-specific) n=1 Tax=Methanosalsum zhilinae (strain DSM 4017 / NBRC 107636 / OCM 62 / WeN5) TaxID=679901 RepID=F7XN43_METZD|nr:DNA methyltransferase [Methanosalsum zhilinae]AEH61159.1 DNA methylase N-4/N-6 domain protein [Methanosalsum zhilinae DSM 4017]
MAQNNFPGNDLSFPLNKLPNKSNSYLRLNTICPYFTMFPLDYPFEVLKYAKSNDKVLDPFCGRGTTNFAARLRGLSSVGIDASPIASAIAISKFTNTTPEQIISLCQEILTDSDKPENVPEGPFWTLCYHSSTLNQICKLRESFSEECNTDTSIALRALTLGILHGPLGKTVDSYLSNQMPRTYASKPNYSVKYWEERGLLPKNIDLLEVVKRRAKYSLSSLPPYVDGGILKEDSRNPIKNSSLPLEEFDWVITSPPYYNMNTYIPDQWIRNWFLGGNDKVEYSYSKQVSHSSKKKFSSELAKVWKSVADICNPNANLMIRFGSLPSSPCNPSELLEESLEEANCGWEINNIKSAGTAENGRRQSEQCVKNLGKAIEEIDLHAILR